MLEEEDKSRRVGDIDDFQVMCEFHPPFLIYARRFTDKQNNVPSLSADYEIPVFNEQSTCLSIQGKSGNNHRMKLV